MAYCPGQACPAPELSPGLTPSLSLSRFHWNSLFFACTFPIARGIKERLTKSWRLHYKDKNTLTRTSSIVFICLNLNTVLLLPGCFFFSTSLSWAVKVPNVLQKNPPGPTIFGFSRIFGIFEHFQTATTWFWEPSFHNCDNWCTDLQKVKTSNGAQEGNTMLLEPGV